jgi:SAM-dependent methyltransferase
MKSSPRPKVPRLDLRDDCRVMTKTNPPQPAWSRIRPIAAPIARAGVRLLGSLPRRPRPAGYFTLLSPRLEGVRWGNWGSRPYEYRWAESIVDIRGLDVLDLGVGLPSQYDWYRHAVERHGPRRFVGIDFDDRIRQEEIHEPQLTVQWMDMTDLQFGDSSFDVIFCLSVFEHLPAESLAKACTEAHRVLRPDGRLVVTLDERWDLDGNEIDWNVLERTTDAMPPDGRSFGMQEFSGLLAPHFVPEADQLPKRGNAERRLLHNREYNSCVSHALFRRAS